jgi:hypothetical protein
MPRMPADFVFGSMVTMKIVSVRVGKSPSLGRRSSPSTRMLIRSWLPLVPSASMPGSGLNTPPIGRLESLSSLPGKKMLSTRVMMTSARYAERAANSKIASAMLTRWPLVDAACAGDGSVDTAPSVSRRDLACQGG